MILNLPEKFSKNDMNYKVEVRNKILYITWVLSFEQLMYDLAFMIYGENECYYCHKKYINKKMTIDHVYPKNYGGVSVPANLLPVCQECNMMKADLNFKEFEKFKRLGAKEKIKYREKCCNRKEKIRYKKGFELPDNWVEEVKISDIIFPKYYIYKYGKKFMKSISFFKKYGNLPKPVILSSNKVLLDGRNLYKSAQKLKLETIPAIILENVVASEDGVVILESA